MKQIKKPMNVTIIAYVTSHTLQVLNIACIQHTAKIL
jgi:hypothetical protein